MPEYYKTQKGYCYKKTQKGGSSRISKADYEKAIIKQKGGAPNSKDVKHVKDNITFNDGGRPISPVQTVEKNMNDFA